MKRSKFTIATIAIVGVLLPWMGVSLHLQTQARRLSDVPKQVKAPLPHPPDEARSTAPYTYRAQARLVWAGVVAPLNSLLIMQRAIAASPSSAASQVPALAILNAPLKTTGLGPIRIGMSIDEVSKTGLTLTLKEDHGSSECQYYRIDNHVEPIGLMAIDDRILRIEVWPGSLTEALSGAKIGTTEQELVDYYGEQLEVSPNSTTQGKTFVFTPKDPGEDIYRLVFETDDRGRVVQYRAGQFPSVTWPEGCL